MVEISILYPTVYILSINYNILLGKIVSGTNEVSGTTVVSDTTVVSGTVKNTFFVKFS